MMCPLWEVKNHLWKRPYWFLEGSVLYTVVKYPNQLAGPLKFSMHFSKIKRHARIYNCIDRFDYSYLFHLCYRPMTTTVSRWRFADKICALFDVTSRSFDLDHPAWAYVILQSSLESPKMVWFWRFKRLGPLKKACPTAWNGHLVDRTLATALFWTQAPFRPVAMATDTLKRNLTCPLSLEM